MSRHYAGTRTNEEALQGRQLEARGSDRLDGPAQPLQEPQEGVVRWWNLERGYGFIMASDGVDVMAHYNDIVTRGEGFKSLCEGQTVTYTYVLTSKGRKAVQVFPHRMD